MISWATCLAISRQADSFSVEASTFLLASNLESIWLYSFTNSPISSLEDQYIGSLFSRLVTLSFWVSKRKGSVKFLVTKKEMIKNRIKITTNALKTLPKTSEVRELSSSSDSKKGIANTAFMEALDWEGIAKYTVWYLSFPTCSSKRASTPLPSTNAAIAPGCMRLDKSFFSKIVIRLEVTKDPSFPYKWISVPTVVASALISSLSASRSTSSKV